MLCELHATPVICLLFSKDSDIWGQASSSLPHNHSLILEKYVKNKKSAGVLCVHLYTLCQMKCPNPGAKLMS